MSVITASYSKPIIADFNDKYVHPYFCEVVQGDVSNVVRQERSCAVVTGTFLPTGSIAYLNADGNGNFIAGSTFSGGTTQAAIPYIVTVGTEHGNVHSEKYNSGCGLITCIPLTVGNDIMTTVFGGSISQYTANTKLVVGTATITVDGATKTVNAIAPSTGGADEVVVGVVRSAGTYHNGGNGVVFTAAFSL